MPHGSSGGHADASWDLLPSIGRPSVHGPSGYSQQDERALFLDFRREARRYQPDLQGDLAWLAVGQHNSLPTRLLDWSDNPLVAAWFACLEGHDKANGLVFMLRFMKSDVLDETLDPFDPALVEPRLVRVPPHVTRITAQHGLFSIHPDPDQAWTPGYQFRFHGFEIPAGEKAYFRQALHAFGFNRGRLMADLDGLGRTLAWQFRTQR